MAASNVSCIGRVSFDSVYHPSAMEEGQEKKYSVTLLIKKKQTDAAQKALLKRMYDKANALSIEKFGCKLGEKNKEGKIVQSPFRCGSEKDNLDGYDDSIVFVRFSGRLKPNVVDERKSPIAENAGFYAGCYAHVTYSLYTYRKVNHGVGFGLGNVQKVANGEPFGAAMTDPDDDFDTVASDDENLDDLDAQFAGAEDDDIPF